jgi:hypothetical protein
MKKLFFITLLLYFTSAVFGQAIYTPQDSAVCVTKFDFALSDSLYSKPIGEVILEIAKSFIGENYEAHTLEKGKKETLVIHLTGFDCYTFIETSLALARLVKMNKSDFSDFEKEILNLRYRNGELTDYSSRLHYFSDWIFDMNKRGICKDVTKEIGGEPYDNQVNFMSEHPQYYERLKDNPEMIEKIRLTEKIISSRKYYYVPQEKIASVEDKIHSGDLLGITTGIDGLDISHTGMAIKMENGRIHLLHAPNVGKKVQISEIPLADYIAQHKTQTGIIVVRPLEPK